MRWAELFESFVLLDIAKIVHASKEPVERSRQVYYTVFNRFHADSLLERITKLPRKDRWQALARAALRDDLYSTVSDMTTAVLESTTRSGDSAEERLKDLGGPECRAAGPGEEHVRRGQRA